MIKVGITGGIGSGKSTVCHLFAQLGIAVYDSDKEAKRLMTENAPLRTAIEQRFGSETYTDGRLNRTALASRVFSDTQALADLNALVHPAVMQDFAQWAERQESPYVLLESAILFEAGLQNQVDQTIAVVAPLELRIERAVRRDNSSAEQIRKRIAAQADEESLRQQADHLITNILEADLEPQVRRLDAHFRQQTSTDATA